MIRFIVVIVAIAVLIAAAPLLLNEKGYVLIAFNNTTIEGSIVAFALMILAALVGVFFIYKLVRYVWSMYSHTRHRFFARSEERKQAAIEQGIWSLINNDSQQIELALANNSVSEQWQDVRYALLAKAELSEHNFIAAVNYLDKISAKNQLKVASLWLASGECSAITGELKALAEHKKASKLELKLYAQVLASQNKWSLLNDFIPKLVKKKALNESEWQQLFERYFNDSDGEVLTQRFNSLPKAVQNQAEFNYLKAMAAAGLLEQIEVQLLKMLKKPEKHADVARILKQSSHGDALKLQARLQDILKSDSNNTQLLLALACLANAHREYDLAARVFDKALNADNREEYQQQAALSYTQSAQPEKALILYQ